MNRAIRGKQNQIMCCELFFQSVVEVLIIKKPLKREFNSFC